MAPEAGSPGATEKTPLPMLSVRFQPTGLPQGTVALGDAGQFLSSLHRYMVRELAVHPRNSDNANLEAQLQTLLVVPEPGSFVAQVIPYLADLPQLYQNIQPVLVVMQSAVGALGYTVLLTAAASGAAAATAAAKEAGKDAYSYMKKSVQSHRRSHAEETRPEQQEPAHTSPTTQATGLTTDDHAATTLREVAKSLEFAAAVLESVTSGHRSLDDPLFHDSAARDAIKDMAKVSNRANFKSGEISVGMSPVVAHAYDLIAPEPARFNDYARRHINYSLSQTLEEEPVGSESAIPVIEGTQEFLTGTVTQMPSYTHRIFRLIHPLYGEVVCNYSFELDKDVVESVQPGRKVLVFGILYVRSRDTRRNQPAEMSVASVRPIG